MPIEQTLKDIQEKLKKRGGYAYDIITGVIAGTDTSDQDADSLFRTLVLDECWEVEDAEYAYFTVAKYLNQNEEKAS